MKPRRGARTWALAAAIAAAGSALTGHRICDLVHRCGCRWIVAGGTDHCNIHRPAPPHCPACTTTSGGAALFGGVFGAWLAVGRGTAALLARRGRP